MADIAQVREGSTGKKYVWCATCRRYWHRPKDLNACAHGHNSVIHPRRWRRYLTEKWGV